MGKINLFYVDFFIAFASVFVVQLSTGQAFLRCKLVTFLYL